MKHFLCVMFLSLCCCAFVNAQTSLEGKVSDDASGEPILFGTVALFKNGVLQTGTETDFDGNFIFSNIEPGTYDVEASYVGYTAMRQEGVIVRAGQTNILNFKITEGILAEEIVIVAYTEPLIQHDNTTSGGTVTAEEIRNLPTKSVNALAATTAGLSSIDGDEVNVRGSRANSTDYYIDGVRVTGLIPESEIEQIQVLTGGLPAQFGDVTGGVISITSKGPSNNFSGGIEAETSEYLDAFGYNQLRASLSGPILKDSKGKSRLGYRFSGQYQYVMDDDPSAVGAYRASEATIRDLEANPFYSVGGDLLASPELLNSGDIGSPMGYSPNEDDRDFNFTGKIDAKLTDNIDITLSGSYDDSKDRFTPGRGDLALPQLTRWSLLNWVNNPYELTSGYRGNFRFRHKIGSQGYGSSDEDSGSSGVFQNAYYTLQLGYEKRKETRDDSQHGGNLFNYGYYGNRNVDYVPQESILTDVANWGGQVVFDIIGRPFAHQGYLQNEGEFVSSSTINSVLGSYNTIDNGNLSSPLNSVWSNLFANVGQVYNLNLKEETDVVTANLTLGFDLLPGGSEKGRHSVQFGITYEQRVERSWSISPRQLWTAARLNANRHIVGIDTTEIIGSFTADLLGVPGAVFDQYRTLITPNNGGQFFQSVRDRISQTTGENVSIYDYANIDGLSPDDLSLDMFSAGELNDFTNINLEYYGYDYLGNKNAGKVSFDDFFSSTDDQGRRTFPVAAVEPIYGAAYIQDKFNYKDIIFRVGVRVDYYDANTKVLKDPYSLYEIETASEFYSTRPSLEQPTVVGDDYSVYISGPGSDQVVGYRQGDQWFRPNGTSVSSGSELFGGGIVTPAIKGASLISSPNIQDPDFNPDFSFEDYKPQFNIMPRLAFSFPISEDAGFFAHYDILVQRPQSNTIATALDYFYFPASRETIYDNPNLKPQKTIDYELGFQQKISDNSAIKVSGYYKEIRDQIQRRVLTNTFPVSNYETYDNIDFGTVKGFSFAYDRRRQNNFQFTANYTLQFADGSGSDANSSQGLNNRGVIRNLSPLGIDERHTLNAILDYRFSDGRNYDGPRIGGADIFANAGINMQLTTVSGRPYTQERTVQQLGGAGFIGGINEARLPWRVSMDLRIDKRFTLFKGEGKKGMGLNVYMRIQNALNAKNVTGVYSVSGDPEDDGFLVSQFGQDRLETVANNGQSVDNFLDAYDWRLLQSGFYTFPRRIFVGAIVEF